MFILENLENAGRRKRSGNVTCHPTLLSGLHGVTRGLSGRSPGVNVSDFHVTGLDAFWTASYVGSLFHSKKNNYVLKILEYLQGHFGDSD